jgi:asparagine synthase (glutamine-hydrolysing)
MCGIAGIFGNDWSIENLEAMQTAQDHRGFDDRGIFIDCSGLGGLSHNRLSIVDLSKAGHQPFKSADENYRLVLNGEIYNYLELRRELEADFDFQTRTDTEVLLAAFQKWGTDCLDRLIGMFAFIVWDKKSKSAFAARDRFGVKPLYYHRKDNGTLFLASEIKAIHNAGIKRVPNEKIWADYLTHGLVNHSAETFWNSIYQVPAGHFLTWKNGETNIKKWYELSEKIATDFDNRPETEVCEEYLELLKDSVNLRFRADVPIGINLSGGVDSSTLLGLVHALEKPESEVSAYTFTTGDARYDELPWVEKMLKKTAHPLVVSKLEAADVPDLAASIQESQDEPFGGIPTLAYAKLFAAARQNGTIVLLDGNGLDEQWAGYDYYAHARDNQKPMKVVQGTRENPVRPNCLNPDFRALAKPPEFPEVFPDRLRNMQYRDAFYTKIPRAMRYNDRISMRVAAELREPFLDHRLFELAFRQPPERKIKDGVHKKMLREIVKELVPASISEAPKRALQTPQREWLRGHLRDWADNLIVAGVKRVGSNWLDIKTVFEEWENYCTGKSDNSFYVWQWISIGLMAEKFNHTESKFELHGYQSKFSRQTI